MHWKWWKHEIILSQIRRSYSIDFFPALQVALGKEKLILVCTLFTSRFPASLGVFTINLFVALIVKMPAWNVCVPVFRSFEFLTYHANKLPNTRVNKPQISRIVSRSQPFFNCRPPAKNLFHTWNLCRDFDLIHVLAFRAVCCARSSAIYTKCSRFGEYLNVVQIRFVIVNRKK